MSILSGDGTRHDFYTLSRLDKSPIINDFLASLDLHLCSANLLPRAAHKNVWNNARLLHEQKDYKTVVINAES